MTKEVMKKFDSKLIEELLESADTSDFFGSGGFLDDLKSALVNKILEQERDNTLGYSKHDKCKKNNTNRRNGSYKKTVKSKEGSFDIQVPRDRDGEYEPIFIPKGVRRFNGFDEKVIAMYGRGMSNRDIADYIGEIYGTEVSRQLISDVTDTVIEQVKEWQNRPLEAIYPIVYLDCLFVKIRDGHTVKNKAVYLALGVNMEGQKEILGMWIQQTEGAKFWLQIITELQNRGVEKIFIACVDGLSGFENAIHSVFPKTIVQRCIVHMVRQSLNYVSWQDRKELAGDLREVYTAPTEDAAKQALDWFADKWDAKYPIISDIWRRNWDSISPFFAFPDFIRKAIYTTNAIEAVNRQIRKVIKTKGVFPNEQSVMKILFLALQNAAKKWTMPIRNWKQALNQFVILYPEVFNE